MIEFIDIFRHSIMITGFIFVMMLMIEYIDVQTKGIWQANLKERKYVQYFIAAILGAIPGCLGAFTVVTLFSHNIFSIGALVTAMIATSGDESFLMFAMIPKTALLITIVILFTGIFAGILTDKFFPKKLLNKIRTNRKLPFHKEVKCICYQKGAFFYNLRNLSLQRGVLMISSFGLFIGFLLGEFGPKEWNWVRITLLLTSAFSFFVCSTVPKHFLEEHLWDHIAKKHIPKIFIYTFAVLFIIHFLQDFVAVEQLISDNLIVVLIVAIIIGIIPESGPHMIFLTLFINGTIPLSILLASSIVQDGHGMLPMLAESKLGFFSVKFINVIFALVIGLILLNFGL